MASESVKQDDGMMGESWRPIADLIGDEKRALSERMDAARTILGTLYELSDDPIVKDTYDNMMKLITYINDARYDAEMKLTSQ